MKNIWIIGAGNIAQEYAKILNSLGYAFTVIGRGEEKARLFKDTTGHEVIIGGLNKYLSTNPNTPEYAIVAVNLGSLSSTCITLMNYGVKNILCEKPGFLYPSECAEVLRVAEITKSNVYLAYNRRFYSSVLKAEEIIKEDGGVKSFNFEFTEWGHVIEKLDKPQGDLENWFFANSTHVVDLAFYLGGKPTQISSFTAGILSWHKPAVFAGAGVTDKGALFNYSANWAAPGRWGVEILTANHRLYFRPMEELQIQNIGSVKITPVVLDNTNDNVFKPGFFLQTKAFLEGNISRLCTINDQYNNLSNIYMKIINF